MTYQFGTNLRTLRASSGLTQVQLAFKVGVNPKRVSKMEQREKLSHVGPCMVKVCAYFGLEPWSVSIMHHQKPKPVIPARNIDVEVTMSQLLRFGHCVPTKNVFINPF